VGITLPGEIEVDWSPDEIADAIRILTTALLCLATDRPTGLTLANPQMVRCRAPSGELHQCRLTATEHALVRFLLSHGPADVDQVRQAVWLGRSVAESTILRACYDVNAALLCSDILWEISPKNSVFVLQEIGTGEIPGKSPVPVT